MTTQVWSNAPSAESVCTVRCVQDEPNMVAKFSLNGSERRLDRLQSEMLSCSLLRLKRTLLGKAKKGMMDIEQDVEIFLSSPDGARIQDEILNRDAWQTGCVLHIGATQLVCRRNHPTIDSLQVKQPAIQGFAVQPQVRAEFVDSFLFRWSARNAEDQEWQLRSESESYTPSQADVGMKLKVELVPAASQKDGAQLFGSMVAFELPSVVREGADLSPYAERLQHVANTNRSGERDDALRVVSYNLLADGTPAQRAGEYSYCSEEAMDVHYRKQLLSWELIQYDADVICLQEVTPHAYRTYMEPQLKQAGWTGVYCSKNWNAQMACVVFFKTEKFDLYDQDNVNLHSEWAACKDARRTTRLASVVPQALAAELDRANTVAQIVALTRKEEEGEPLFIVNTHLMGNPQAVLGRVVQVATVLQRLRASMANCGLHDAAVVFCGDFNATPQEPLHDMLRTGRLSRRHPAWAEARASYGKEGGNCRSQQQDGADLSTEMLFHSGANEANTFINHLHPRGGAVVDFVYFSRKHFTLRQGPFPALRPATAIPSASFGSDHVALVQDLVWARRSQAA